MSDAAPRVLLFGSGNAKKLLEIRRGLDGVGVTVVGTTEAAPGVDAPDETAGSFRGNSAQKALYYADRTGLLTLADDSGLEVDALGGDPGVDSAYFAGHPTNDAANNAKLLTSLAAVPDHLRTARYRCVLTLALPGRVLLVTEGACDGVIARVAGGSGGFGYDPLFLVPGTGRSYGELDPAAKDRISHRGQALRALRAALPSILTGTLHP